MRKPSADLLASNIYKTNFYNVNNFGDNPSATGTTINAPSFTTTRVNVLTSSGRNASAFRDPVNTSGTNATGYAHIATIVYDRYARDATITWHADEYTGGTAVPTGGTIVMGDNSPPKK